MTSCNLGLLGQGIINWAALWKNSERGEHKRETEEEIERRGRWRDGGREEERKRSKSRGRERGEKGSTCVCVCVWGREREESMGETGVNVRVWNKRGEERVCVCEREVRFTHASTIMPSWRVECSILYIIQEKHTHRVNVHKLCV